MRSILVQDCHYGGLNPVLLGQESCKPRHSFGPAVRTHWLLHYVVSGFGTFVRDETAYRVGPGQIFVIQPHLRTYYEADREHPWSYIWIGFRKDGSLADVFSQPVISCPAAHELFDEMLASANMENGRSAFLSGCLWRLVGLLLEQKPIRADYVDKAISCMQSEYANGITIREIAGRLGLDRSYLCALFSKRMGMSPKAYLINLRLTKAAALMTVHGASPSMAALSVGYQNIYHFSKMFKMHFGVSPRAYRNACLSGAFPEGTAPGVSRLPNL